MKCKICNDASLKRPDTFIVGKDLAHSTCPQQIRDNLQLTEKAIYQFEQEIEKKDAEIDAKNIDVAQEDGELEKVEGALATNAEAFKMVKKQNSIGQEQDLESKLNDIDEQIK